ncbi:MAG TPA: hypothetical protein VGE74_04420 [Gemmata sp.]
MSVSQDQSLQIEKTVARVLRGARANDTAALPKQHTHRTPQCLAVSRLLALAKHGAVRTTDEQQHLDGCAFCRHVFDTFNGIQRSPVLDDDTTTIISFNASEETTRIDPPKEKPANDTPPTAT